MKHDSFFLVSPAEEPHTSETCGCRKQQQSERSVCVTPLRLQSLRGVCGAAEWNRTPNNPFTMLVWLFCLTGWQEQQLANQPCWPRLFVLNNIWFFFIIIIWRSNIIIEIKCGFNNKHICYLGTMIIKLLSTIIIKKIIITNKFNCCNTDES